MGCRPPDKRLIQRIRHHAAASLRLYPTVLCELDLFHGSEVTLIGIIVVVMLILSKLVLVSAT